jgi:hypothetical protein
MSGALAEEEKHVKIVMNYLVESELSFATRPAGRSLLFVCWHEKGKWGPGVLHCFRACRAISLAKRQVDPWTDGWLRDCIAYIALRARNSAGRRATWVSMQATQRNVRLLVLVLLAHRHQLRANDRELGYTIGGLVVP